MRHARPKPSIMLAVVAVAAVAAPLIVSVGADDPSLVDRTKRIGNTAIEQVPLRELPAAVLDITSSGLDAVGVKLPEIDPNVFTLPDGLPDVTVPLPATPPSGSTTSPAPASSDPTPSNPSSAPTQTPTPSKTQTPSKTPPKTGPRPKTPGGSTPQATIPRLADGRTVGAAVTTIVRDKPLKMVAFTWDRPVDVDLVMRSRRADGGWTPWSVLEPALHGAVPSAGKPVGTEPVWVGDAREVQVAATDEGLAIPAAETQGGDLAQLGVGMAGEVVTKLVTTALSAVKATLISPDSILSLGSSLLTPLLGGPSVVARAQWGADESIRCSQPIYSPTVGGAIVHHTAGNNDYTAQQSVEIVRGIYAYHARTLNWCDIGYNVLVDKYGQVFEGAFGGLDRNVEGTHTGGFNKATVGLSLMGNLDQVPPTAAMISAASRFLRWRLGKAGLNAGGTAHLTAEYFSDSKFPAGARTQLPMIAGHRDYNNTSCPGVHGYSALNQIRAMSGAAPAAPAAPASP
ncbi:N-acetylmuramoyl-L-alanine amidase [Gordonia sp. ABSL1-1]|uniref:N-acetylmuramoyl-L-alanine amidase n=1 Tax=Gordonia sp. ABSL1-1 TaxID=3053923 RepID=UPI002572E0A3|nr:N-acetylmuramoyl-L-alanine amidase [Gordonia sp. ABSL1-1]MDL9937638.1 N-acetylmuramoyl-L-alanine amidase [Gordonia sp. ABSL1-1]